MWFLFIIFFFFIKCESGITECHFKPSINIIDSDENYLKNVILTISDKNTENCCDSKDSPWLCEYNIKNGQINKELTDWTFGPNKSYTCIFTFSKPSYINVEKKITVPGCKKTDEIIKNIVITMEKDPNYVSEGTCNYTNSDYCEELKAADCTGDNMQFTAGASCPE